MVGQAPEEKAMSESAFEYDESEWPIVRVVSPDGAIDDDSFARNLQRLSSYLERRQPLVFVIELRSRSTLSVEQRDAIRRHETRQRELIAQFQRGIGIVTRSTFQRAMISAIFWLVRSPSPTQAFSDVESAMAWARTLLGQPRAERPRSSAAR
jgi:hypothetical protein